MYGKYEKKIPVRLFTDSEPTLESIASTRPIETKRLRNQVQELKEVLLNGEVESFAWLSSKDMLADALTKEMKMNQDLEDLLNKNIFHLSKSSVNEVKAIEDELRMFNIRNRKTEVEEDLSDDQETKHGKDENASKRGGREMIALLYKNKSV